MKSEINSLKGGSKERMANAIVLGEELTRGLACLSARLNRGVDKLVIEAIERFVEQEKAKAELVEIVELQFRTPFKIP